MPAATPSAPKPKPSKVDEWRAGPDGVGHAIPRRGALRTACREVPIDIRWSHPVRTRCVECLDVTGIIVQAPVSESEQRAIWGDR